MKRARTLAMLGVTWLVLFGSAQAASASNLSYHNGPVSHSMDGVLVDWGSDINSVYTDETSGDPGLIRYLAGASGSTQDIGGVLAQYMDNSGHNAANSVRYGQQYQITPSVTSTTVYDSDIQSELVSQIQAGHLPHPAGDGLQTMYLVLFPSSDTECIDSRTCSGSNFCAYHGNTTLPDGTNVLYAVLPDNMSGPMTQGCGTADTLFEDQTSYLSHEWSETITDPLGSPGAWYDRSGNEIGDKCNQLMGSNGGWTVQLEWSNLDTSCEGSEPAYSAPNASFLAAGSAATGEAVSFDGSSSSDPTQDRASISGTSYSISSGIASYQWSWGDGTSTAAGGQPTATHLYSVPGTYQVSLTVTDNLGFTSTVTHQIAITGPAPTAGARTPQPTSGASSTPSGAPSSTTGPVLRVTSTGATVSGKVKPNGVLTRYHVEYGTSKAYGHSSAAFSAGAGTLPVSVTVTLTGLRARTIYHYRVVASSTGGTSVGADRTFTTSSPPPPPPRFSFHVRKHTSLRAALRGHLQVRFSCSKACAAHFALTIAVSGRNRFVVVPVTLARANGRIRSAGSGTATLKFTASAERNLARAASLKVLISGYAVGAGTPPSAPRTVRLTLR